MNSLVCSGIDTDAIMGFVANQFFPNNANVNVSLFGTQTEDLAVAVLAAQVREPSCPASF
jgi:hypothetical protein